MRRSVTRARSSTLGSCVFASALAAASPDEAAELARLRARTADLRKSRTPLTNGGILQIGDRRITRDAEPAEKLEAMYREGRSSPMRAWQTLLDVGRALEDSNRVYSGFVDFDVLALLICCDDAARAKIEAFLATLPPETRRTFRSPERVLAPVFNQWLWHGDWPARFIPWLEKESLLAPLKGGTKR